MTFPNRRSLVDSVRGRRLLWELLTPLHTADPWWGLELPDVPAPADDVVLPSLRWQLTAAGDGVPSEAVLRTALAATVDKARVDARMRTDGLPPSLASSRASVIADEARFAARHRESDVPWSGEWWSTPGYELVTTTRAAEGVAAVHLALVEDECGWTAADVEPVAVETGARVLEVTSADDWAALAARYPLEVTHSRRHDWHRTTGRLGRWFLPDFAAVAEDYDAVHVTVAGYLDTAGEAVPVPGRHDGATVLAGWSPDQTWWLQPDLLTPGPARRWERTPDPDSPWDWVSEEP